MKVYYARVSTTDQDLEVQLEDAKKLGADKAFQEKASGLDADRPELKAALEFCREGDTLYAMRADRLARSAGDLLGMVESLAKKGVKVHFTKQPELSTDTAHGELMLTVLAGVAKFETRLRAERQKEGIAKAKERGVKWGRKPVIDAKLTERIKELQAEGLSMTEIAKRLGVSRATAYRALE